MLGTPYFTYALIKLGKIIIFLNYYKITYTYKVLPDYWELFLPHGDPLLTLGLVQNLKFCNLATIVKNKK